MIFPICGFDAKNAVLCPQCEAKVEKGELTKADVEASITLAKIAKLNKEIENFTLFSCKDFGGNFILSMAKNDIMAIRQSRTLYRLIQDQFKEKIWLVEADETDKKFIEDLFFPTKILTINLYNVLLCLIAIMSFFAIDKMKFPPKSLHENKLKFSISLFDLAIFANVIDASTSALVSSPFSTFASH